MNGTDDHPDWDSDKPDPPERTPILFVVLVSFAAMAMIGLAVLGWIVFSQASEIDDLKATIEAHDDAGAKFEEHAEDDRAAARWREEDAAGVAASFEALRRERDSLASRVEQQSTWIEELRRELKASNIGHHDRISGLVSGVRRCKELRWEEIAIFRGRDPAPRIFESLQDRLGFMDGLCSQSW